MLGITTPDAIAIGTLVIAVLAAWRGTQTGNDAKKAEPPAPTPLSLGMATFADTAMMGQLVSAVNSLSAAIHDAIEADKKRDSDHMAERLAELSRKLDERLRAG